MKKYTYLRRFLGLLVLGAILALLPLTAMADEVTPDATSTTQGTPAPDAPSTPDNPTPPPADQPTDTSSTGTPDTTSSDPAGIPAPANIVNPVTPPDNPDNPDTPDPPENPGGTTTTLMDEEGNEVDITVGTVTGDSTTELTAPIQPDLTTQPGNEAIDSDQHLRNDGSSTTTSTGDESFDKTLHFKGDLGLQGSITYRGPDTDSDEGYGYTVHQFELYDDAGNKIYTYCMDLDTAVGDDVEYTYEQLINADYLDSKAVEQIRTIALNGYWGTETGAGSMDAFQELLKDSKIADLDKLTPGEALLATQAAIWYYGQNPSNREDDQTEWDPEDDIIQRLITGYKSNGKYTWSAPLSNDTAQANRINAVYKALLALSAENPMQPVTHLDSSVTITPDVTVTNLSSSGATGDVTLNFQGNSSTATPPADGSEVAAASAPAPSIQGEFTVTVKDRKNREVHKEEKVTTLDSYTFRDLDLNETYTVSITGTQTLPPDAYIFTGSYRNSDGETVPSQTMVGIMDGTYNVDLAFQLAFAAELPEAPTDPGDPDDPDEPGKPETPGKPTQPDDPSEGVPGKNPKTGDQMIRICLLVNLLSAAGLLVLLAHKCRIV